MKVIDLRPAWEKAFLKKWGESKSGSGNNLASRFLGRAWGDIIDFWMDRRVSRRKKPDTKPFLVSVGNLSLGGTGKTPVIMALARSLHEEGLKGAVLTRGYKSPLTGPVEIQPENELAGDEARLMAVRLKDLGWPVIQARQRLSGLDFLAQNYPHLDLVLLEDCHQTGDVGRHLDIIILDDWSCKSTGQGEVLVPLAGPVFPLGPYRESIRGARRADIFLVESADNLPVLTSTQKPVSRFTREAQILAVANESSVLKEGQRIGLVSGIARPGSFEVGAAQLLGHEPALSIRLQDHQGYGPRLVNKVLQHFQENDISALVTTEKDWVKLEPFWPPGTPAFVVKLDINWARENALHHLVKERVG